MPLTRSSSLGLPSPIPRSGIASFHSPLQPPARLELGSSVVLVDHDLAARVGCNTFCWVSASDRYYTVKEDSSAVVAGSLQKYVGRTKSNSDLVSPELQAATSRSGVIYMDDLLLRSPLRQIQSGILHELTHLILFSLSDEQRDLIYQVSRDLLTTGAFFLQFTTDNGQEIELPYWELLTHVIQGVQFGEDEFVSDYNVFRDIKLQANHPGDFSEHRKIFGSSVLTRRLSGRALSVAQNIPEEAILILDDILARIAQDYLPQILDLDFSNPPRLTSENL